MVVTSAARITTQANLKRLSKRLTGMIDGFSTYHDIQPHA